MSSSSLNFQVLTFNSVSLSPFPATLTNSLQTTEKPATLSPAFATLRSHVKHKSCVCRSSKKHPGLHPSGQVFSFRTQATYQSRITKSFIIRSYAKCAPDSFRMNTSKTQDLKPFRMNTYKKRGEGARLVSWFPYDSTCSKNRGAFRNFVACSKPYASLIKTGSLHARPKNEMPTGKP
jgi:hypothetical protein